MKLLFKLSNFIALKGFKADLIRVLPLPNSSFSVQLIASVNPQKKHIRFNASRSQIFGDSKKATLLLTINDTNDEEGNMRHKKLKNQWTFSDGYETFELDIKLKGKRVQKIKQEFRPNSLVLVGDLSENSDLEKPIPTSKSDLVPTPTPEPEPEPEPEPYDGIIKSVRGKGKLKGTKVGDAFTFDSFEPFTKKAAVKIIGFDASEGDTIAVSPVAFPGLKGVSDISFASTKSKRELKQLFNDDYDFVHFEKTGRLYFDGNGSDKNWGNSDEGGLVAILKGKPQLTAEDITLLA